MNRCIASKECKSKTHAYSCPMYKPLSDTDIDISVVLKALPNLCSADLELVITQAAYLLRKEAYREAMKTIQMASDPKVIELLKQYEK